jgi:hypothetical protein
MAHHHDAIAYGFLGQKSALIFVVISKLMVSKNVMRKYFSHRSDKSADQAADSMTRILIDQSNQRGLL